MVHALDRAEPAVPGYTPSGHVGGSEAGDGIGGPIYGWSKPGAAASSSRSSDVALEVNAAVLLAHELAHHRALHPVETRALWSLSIRGR